MTRLSKILATFTAVLGIAVHLNDSVAADDPLAAVIPPSGAALSGIQEQAIAGIFTSCSGGINQGIAQTGQALQQALGGSTSRSFISIGTDCNILPGQDPMIVASGRAPDLSNLSCDNFMVGGQFNKEAYDKMIKRLEASVQVNQCKKSKMTAAQGELKCLNDQAHALDNIMSQLSESYLQAMQRNQTAVQQLKSMEADRQGQQADVRRRLNGEENGKPGLRQLLKDSQVMLSRMDAEVTQVDNMVRDSKTARGKLVELYSQMVGAQAAGCFSQKQDSKYLCDSLRPGEKRPPEAYNPSCAKGSACDWLMCRYWENQHLTNGKLDKSEFSQNKASEATKVLSGILSSMMGEMPKTNKNATDYLLTMRDNYSTIKTSADIEKAFGSQLAGLNGKGFDIRGNVLSIVKSCFSDANRRVALEKNNPGTALYEAKVGVDKGDQALQGTISSLLTNYSHQWQDNMAGLTGLNLPLDVNRCRSSSSNPDLQLGCIKQFRTNMEALITGGNASGIPVGGIQMQIKGTNAQNTISFNCQGLKGCVTALENTDRNLGEEIRRVGDFKKNYILQANNSIDAYTKRVAGMLGPQMRDLDLRLKAINTSLGSLGAGGLDIKMKTGRAFSKDEDGLYVMTGGTGGGRGGGGASTIQDAIAASQPYLDVQGSNLSDSVSSMGEAISKIDDDYGRAMDAIAKISGLEVSCRTTYADKQLATASTATSSLLNCVQTLPLEQCESWKPQISRLAESWSSISQGDFGYTGGQDIANALGSGLNCKANAAAPQNCPIFASTLNSARMQLGRALGKDSSAQDASGGGGPSYYPR